MDDKTLKIGVITEKPADYLSIDDLLYGQRHFVRDGQTYKEVTKEPASPVRTLKDRNYSLYDTDSFTRYVEQYGNADTGIIFYTSSGLTMFLDEKNRVEQVTHHLTLSLEMRTFLSESGVRKEFSQKDLLKAIETFPEVVGDIDDLLPRLKLLQMSKVVDFESDIDPHNHTFIYKEKAGDQTTKLPKSIILTLPYFEGSENILEIAVDFEVEMPTSENAKPVFTLSNAKADRTKKEALEREIETIKERLSGWNFMQGSF